MLQALKEAIEREGVGIGTEVVKVDSFLNHRIDVKLMDEMGRAFYEKFGDAKADLVMTIESSGIAPAVFAAHYLGNIPVVYGKKGATRNASDDVYTAEVYSFTHQKLNVIRVDRKYLPAGSRVLIIDDFMANGAAVKGLTSIIEQAGCTCAGIGICVEKGFQPGGQYLRDHGFNYLALAIVDQIVDGKIVLRED